MMHGVCFIRYYESLPPVSKAYGVFCLLTTTAYYFQFYDPWDTIALEYGLVFRKFQVNSFTTTCCLMPMFIQDSQSFIGLETLTYTAYLRI